MDLNGADMLDGGADNNTYTVETFSYDGNSANDDVVIELADGGTADLVMHRSATCWPPRSRSSR